MIAFLLFACSGDPELPETQAVAGANQVVELGQSIRLDGSDSEGVSALWDFGDGTQKEGFVAEHTYTKAGNYNAVLQVTGKGGARKTDGIRVVAHLPFAEQKPVWSSTIAVHPVTSRVYLVNPEFDSITVFSPDGSESSIVDTCRSPRTLVLDVDTDRLLVACEKSDAVDVFSAESLVHEATVSFELGARPFGVVARDGVWWAGLQGSNSLVRFDETGEVERLEDVPDPRGLALDADGRVIATRWRSVDDQGLLYRSDGAEIGLALDTNPDSDTTSGGVPTQLDSVSVSPDGGALYVPGHQANLLRGLYQNGLELTFETTVRAVVRVVLEGVEYPALTKLFDERGHANVVQPSLYGNFLYVLHPGTQSVSILDAYSGATAGSILNVGHTPTGLALSPDGQRLYVHAWLDRALRMYDVSDLSIQPPLLGQFSSVDEEVLSEAVLAGKRVFYSSADTRMTRSGYLTCAHCHADGRDDGVVWDFTDRGEGLRNTTSLEGMGSLPEGPIHWTGNFDELQDFEQDIRLTFGGVGFLEDALWADTEDALGSPKAGLSQELDDLAAFVLSLTEVPTSPFLAPAGGEQAFLDAGCDVCHAAPYYTDSTLESFLRHDVGTLTDASGSRRGEAIDGLDTPSLRGVFATPPYLHDGSAPDLVEAIRAHDSASALDEETLSLIAAFVRSL